MKTISSRDNPLYKELKLIASTPQARRKMGRTVLDGVHLCEAYLQQVGRPALCVVSDRSQSHPEVAEIVTECESAHVSCVNLPVSLYQALSQVENGIDLLFVIDLPHVAVQPKIENTAVLLDNLQDPGNLGSILRSAAAAGITSIFCGKGTASAWSPKVLRAGMGAHFALHIEENVDLIELIRRTKLPVLGTSSHAQQKIYDVDLKQPVVWLFGHEGQGVSSELIEFATHQVSVPHLGTMESLNVAASAAICFFEQVRQKLL